jgi:hypothetical protein
MTGDPGINTFDFVVHQTNTMPLMYDPAGQGPEHSTDLELFQYRLDNHQRFRLGQRIDLHSLA